MNMLRLFAVLSLICGVLYPLAVTGLAQLLFAHQSQGSLITRNGVVVGSSLLAQKFSSPQFFSARPSAANYATVSSGATQASPTHKAAMTARLERQHALPHAGVDGWTTSGSGLDPHISPETARAQLPRVAAARGLTEDALKPLILAHTETETWGIWGRPRVNVLALNLALDARGKDDK